MGDGPIAFADSMYSIEANLIVARATTVLTAAGIPVSAGSINAYMANYLSQDLVAKHHADIELILAEVSAHAHDIGNGFIWDS